MYKKIIFLLLHRDKEKQCLKSRIIQVTALMREYGGLRIYSGFVRIFYTALIYKIIPNLIPSLQGLKGYRIVYSIVSNYYNSGTFSFFANSGKRLICERNKTVIQIVYSIYCICNITHIVIIPDLSIPNTSCQTS